LDKLRLLARRFPKTGPWLWILGLLQYFSVQYIVALSWPQPFSLKQNSISDLGNTVCGQQNHLFICSPLHNVMNISLIIVGLSMSIGVLAALEAFRLSKPAMLTFLLLGLTGLGTALIGVFPENVVPSAHYLIAAISLIIFNCGALVAYRIPELPASWRWYSLATGSLGLLALVVLGLRYPTQLGPGVVERIADYTPDIWVFAFSAYILVRHKKGLFQACR